MESWLALNLWSACLSLPCAGNSVRNRANWVTHFPPSNPKPHPMVVLESIVLFLNFFFSLFWYQESNSMSHAWQAGAAPLSYIRRLSIIPRSTKWNNKSPGIYWPTRLSTGTKRLSGSHLKPEMSTCPSVVGCCLFPSSPFLLLLLLPFLCFSISVVAFCRGVHVAVESSPHTRTPITAYSAMALGSQPLHLIYCTACRTLFKVQG